MIDAIQTHSKHLIVSPGMRAPIYNTYGPGTQSAGMMRYNITTFQIEVYDGTIWHRAIGTTGVGLSPDAESAIDWAKQKMLEEAQLKEKMERYPTLKDAYEQFKIIEALVINDGEKLKDV